MGFPASVAERAASATRGGVEAAVERALRLVDEDEAKEAAAQQGEDAGEEKEGEGEAKEADVELSLRASVPATTQRHSPSAHTPLTSIVIDSVVAPLSSLATSPSANEWTCSACTLVNPLSARRCEACRTRRATSPTGADPTPGTPRDGPVPYPSSASPPPDPSLPPNCGICLEHVAASQLVLSSCGHNFCRDCWVGYLTSKVNDGQVLALHCPHPKCPRPLPSAEVLGVLPPALHSKFDRFRTNAEIALDPNARWCPTVNCESVMVGSRSEPRLKCRKCAQALCFNCNERWHEGRTCEEAANAVMVSYKKTHDVRACPQCAATIERSEGCSHMTCTRCAHQFCWLCGRKYTKHHFAFWNLRGCPGLQDGSLSCIGNDAVLCFNCGCGCGCAGMVKRSLFKLWVVFTMVIFAVVFSAPGAVFALVCSPCLWWKWKKYKKEKADRAAAREAERVERRRRRRERQLARDEIDETGRVLSPEERRARRAKRRADREAKEAKELEEVIQRSKGDFMSPPLGDADANEAVPPV